MLRTSQLGLMVYDLDADSAIYRFNEYQTMRPAFTMKVITAIAALDKLGGSHQFKTELCYTGSIENRTLTGNVYCVGGFDPRFNANDMHAFVESLQKMGVDTIRGTLYTDKSMKTTDRRCDVGGLLWPQSQTLGPVGWDPLDRDPFLACGGPGILDFFLLLLRPAAHQRDCRGRRRSLHSLVQQPGKIFFRGGMTLG